MLAKRCPPLARANQTRSASTPRRPAIGKKVLHALDSDLYLVYRAPVAGLYRLEIAPITDEASTFAKPESLRWREDGIAPQAVTFPDKTPWPAGKSVPLSVAINPLELKGFGASRNVC